jgi:ABC-type antimicrobial peptide transport system permease subunit
MVGAGAIGGLVLGMMAARFAQSLFFQVAPTDWTMIALPWLAILSAALIAAIVPVLRAIQVDPVEMLRAE